MVTQLLGVKEKYIHYDPLDYDARKGHGALGRHLLGASNYMHSPVSYTETESVRLVTNIYERETEKLIWTAVTETLRPKSVQEVINSLSSTVMKNLRANKLIK